MYDVFIMPYPKNNSKETYELFIHSGRLTLKQVIYYRYRFKYKSDQYDLDWLDWIGLYMRNSLDPSLLDNMIKNTTVTPPGPVVLVLFFTIASVSFETTEKHKSKLAALWVADNYMVITSRMIGM